LRKYDRAGILLLCLLLIVPAAYAQGWRPARSLEPKTGMGKNRQINVRTVAMSEKTMVFEYAMPDLEAVFTENGVNADAKNSETLSGPVKPVLGNAIHRSEPGMPVLPVVPARIVLPEGHDLDDVRVTPGKKLSLPGGYLVEHGQTPHPRIPGVKPEKTEKNRAVYESDNPYPAKLVEIVGVQKKRGVSILLVNLHPVVYRPKSGTLSWYETLTLTVITKPVGSRTGTGTLPYKPPATGILDRSVENPETVNSYTEKKTEIPLAEGAIYPRATARYVLITSQAIIDDDAIDPSVDDFITHRQSQGLTTDVISIESILANAAYTGRDDAETLRNFIIDAYTNRNTDYVLLGGDTNIIPLRKLRCELRGVSEEEMNIPSDLYYQCLDGDFNFDGDEYWGERTDGEGGGDVDLMAEIYVGRASAETAAELSNFFYKTMAYETDADDAAYLTTALMAGEWLGFGGVSEYGADGLEEIRLGSDNYGYTTAGFAAFNFTVDTLYDSDTYTWPASEIISDIDSNAYSIIVHDGHGDTDWVMKLDNTDADSLANTNFIFAYSHACFPGNYEGDCIAEHQTTSDRNGMFAVVYNSRSGWGLSNSTNGPSQKLCRQFWDACFGEGLADLGAMNTDSHEDNLGDISDPYIRWSIYETNLLGDPYTELKGRFYASLEIDPDNATESDGVLLDRGVLTTDATVSSDLAVSLTSSDTTEVTVPALVTIPAGQSSVTFDITVLDDLLLDGPQAVVVSAIAPGFTTASDTITITDTDVDTDGDTLSDDLEDILGTAPDDADTDDDGITDGDEDANHNGVTDTGETDTEDIDSDGDGIQDGTELGYTDEDIGPGTDTNVFQPDLDPDTVTDPLDTDTDGDGLADGEEDANHNGQVDAGETDPSVNVRPTADAGADQTVDEGDRADLDGTGSFDIDDGITSYVWSQTAGPTVTILNSHTARASFTAPDVATDQALTFRLSVRDRAGQLTSDTCTVTVRWDGVAPPNDDTPPAAGGGGGGCFIQAVR